MLKIRSAQIKKARMRKLIPKSVKRANRLLALFNLILGIIMFCIMVPVHCIILSDIKYYAPTIGKAIGLIICTALFDGGTAFTLIAGIRLLSKNGQ